MLKIIAKRWKIVLELLIIVLLLFTAGCAQTITEEGTDMSLDNSALNNEIPPIDRLIPDKLETATFALG